MRRLLALLTDAESRGSNRLTGGAAAIKSFVLLTIAVLAGLLVVAAARSAVRATAQPAGEEPVETVFLPVLANTPCRNPLPGYSEALPWHVETVKANTVWGCSSGRDVIIAIIDSGVEYQHPDLAPNLLPGYSNVIGDSNPDVGPGYSPHGTHVAGIAAAVAHNGPAIGMAPQARILPIKVLDRYGMGYDWNVADGILKATDMGAKVINLSLGRPQMTPDDDAVMLAHVRYATERNRLVVAAAGNCGDINSWRFNNCLFHNSPSIPAAFPEAVSVVSVNRDLSHSVFSTQGNSVEVAAAGAGIMSTVLLGGYETYSGTSMASPGVAGVAALIWAHNPNLTAEQVRQLLRTTARDLGAPGFDPYFGHGLVQADAALARVYAPPAAAAAPVAAESAVIPTAELPFAPGQLIVWLDAGQTPAEVWAQAAQLRSPLASYSPAVLDARPAHNFYLLSAPAGQERAFTALWRTLDGVRAAAPNFVQTQY